LSRFPLRRLAAVGAVAALIAALTGCATITNQTVTQKNGIGDVHIVTDLTWCLSPTPDQAVTCSLETGQLFMGYRVPAGVEPPASIATTSGPALTLTRNASYESELQRIYPAGTGEKWIGYVSGELTTVTGAVMSGTVAIDLPLPKPADGSPYSGPYAYRTVTGGRNTGEPFFPLAGDDVTCAEDVTPDPLNGKCVDFPSTPAAVAPDEQIATRDARIVPGAQAPAVYPGNPVTVPFTLAFAGPDPSAVSFALAAVTNLAGASAMPSSATATPVGPDSPLAVTIAVPKNAGPGTYTTTLTGTVAGTQSRSGTASYTVKPLPPAPIAKLSGSRTLKPKHGRLTLPLSCPAAAIDPCAGTVTLKSTSAIAAKKKHRKKARKRTVTFAKGSFAIAPGQTSKLRLRLTKLGSKALAKNRKVRVSAIFTGQNRAGAQAQAVTALVLKAEPVKHRKHKRHKKQHKH
jgi:hypothetical protein